VTVDRDTQAREGTLVAAVTGTSLLTTERRVALSEVDAAGILYFAAPYRWLEESFTGWLKDIGRPLSVLLRQGSGCPCVTSAASYGVPLVLDDEISVSLRASSVGTTSFSVTMEATRLPDGPLAVRASGWHVWSRFDGRGETPTVAPEPLPDWLRTALSVAPPTSPVQTRTHQRAEADS